MPAALLRAAEGHAGAALSLVVDIGSSFFANSDLGWSFGVLGRAGMRPPRCATYGQPVAEARAATRKPENAVDRRAVRPAVAHSLLAGASSPPAPITKPLSFGDV